MAESVVREFRLPDAEATERLGTWLARTLPEPRAAWMILLQGELGAGKSTLARALLHALGYEGPVPSPTYTLVEPYEFDNGNVYHVDLYRIASMRELEFLGWNDLRDGLMLIEWPERVPTLVDDADLQLRLDYDGTARVAVLEAVSPRAADWLSRAPQQV